MQLKITGAYTPDQNLAEAYKGIVEDPEHKESVKLARDTMQLIVRETRSLADRAGVQGERIKKRGKRKGS
jgi:hypothetical protein